MGYSTDQELLFYQREGHRYQPDVVALIFCSNDVYFNTTGEQGKPWFEVEPEGLVLHGSPVRARKGQWQRGPEARKGQTAGVRGSMALRLISDRASDGNPRLRRTLARLGVLEAARQEALPEEMTPLGTIHHAEVKKMWSLTQALLRQLKAEVEGHGARLVVLYVPDRYQLSDRVWELTRERYQIGKRFDPHRMYRRVQRICLESGIPFLDVLPELTAAESSGAPGYFTHDGHWNEVGHAIAARAIAAFVKAPPVGPKDGSALSGPG